jgi:hypothetical protein
MCPVSEPVSINSTFEGLAFRQDVELGLINGHPLLARRLDGPKRAPGWEMHPDTDELFYVVSGHMEVTLMTAEGGRSWSTCLREGCSSSHGVTGTNQRRSSPPRWCS